MLGIDHADDTVQDHAKLKLAYDFSPTLRATYTLGWWHNDAAAASTPTCATPPATPVQRDRRSTSTGRSYTVLPTDFAPAAATRWST